MNLKYKTIGSKDKSRTKELPIEHIPYVARTSHLSCTHEIPVFFLPLFCEKLVSFSIFN